MKMKVKRMLTILLAVILVFAMAIPAFAAGDTSASYTQVSLEGAPQVTGTFTVYLSVKSNYIDNSNTYISRHLLPVSMGSTGTTKTYYVRDVLVAAMSQYNALQFKDNSGTPITSSSTYVYGVSDSSVSPTLTFAPVTGIDYYNGWMFRVNGKYPLLNSEDWPSGWSPSDGPCGAGISEAYVIDGDVIDFYFADTASLAKATAFTRIDSASYSSSGSTLNLEISSSYSYFRNSDYYWIIDDFYGLDTTSVSVKINNSTYTGTTDEYGELTIRNITLSPGTYTVELLPTFKSYTVSGTTYGMPTRTGAVYTLSAS